MLSSRFLPCALFAPVSSCCTLMLTFLHAVSIFSLGERFLHQRRASRPASCASSSALSLAPCWVGTYTVAYSPPQHSTTCRGTTRRIREKCRPFRTGCGCLLVTLMCVPPRFWIHALVLIRLAVATVVQRFERHGEGDRGELSGRQGRPECLSSRSLLETGLTWLTCFRSS